ncbi:glycosyltransferase family 2 protein [Massilia sp. GCM10020059]|uniref:Glycosyltransferase family 2 protein n=2 Tax=Massilia TaxID=149698 RepID=A0ABS8IWH8_9BURK|nr:glycosyltransferase family A protein [Massilia agrisoli]MCC6071584.1 glycosyltransferase family 2 protein [Massilia agrisoli]
MHATREMSEQPVPEVSVVIPSCGRVDLLDRCLDAIMRQTLEGRRVEVIVVDDNPRHNTRQLVAVWRASAGERGPDLKYLPNNGPGGPAAVRNLGWRSARAPIVAFTEDDTVPSPSWLKHGLDAFTDNVDAVSGRVEMPPTGALTDYQREARRLEQAEFAIANCFCRKSILEKLGGFDERFHAGWPEDFHFRLINMHATIASTQHALVVRPLRPAAWGSSVWQLKNLIFDALLFKTHPQLYRQKIRATPAWDHYATVAALATCAAGIGAGSTAVVLPSAATWTVMTVLLCRKRLRGTSRSPSHVAEMIVTSALIPPAAVFWRLAGAIRFRVRFT